MSVSYTHLDVYKRQVYRIHQFEKQEMIVVCKLEDSMKWYDVMWKNTVDLFRSLDIPVRTLECCSGDLADLKVKSVDVEAWSPRQQKYFEVGSCSNLGDAQARRLNIRVKGEDGKYFAHTLNNTVVEMCIRDRYHTAFIETALDDPEHISIDGYGEKLQGTVEKLQGAIRRLLESADNGRIIKEGIQTVIAVSYTHLDVYKRQHNIYK